MAGDGMTVLMSTHYMDEAERCQRLVYLSAGRIVVSGTAEEVIEASHLAAYDGTGAVEAALHRLRNDQRVGSAGLFGRVLHVAGADHAGLAAAVAEVELDWQMVPPRLDDAFIHLLGESQ
jgi:ABC-type multidrug transport system ATPase subunit